MSRSLLKCPPVTRMQAWRCLLHWSMPSSITLCSTPTHVSIRFCLKSFTSCAFLVDLLPLFWNKCIEVRAVQWTEIWKFIQDYYIIALLDWEQRIIHIQNVGLDTARGKDNDQQNISKTRSSADADNRLDAFSGQSRSTNMVPCHM